MQHLDKVLPIVVKVQPGVQKVFELDGHKYEQLIEHVGVFPMLMSAPSDTGLILDSSHVRRRFFDGLISQIDRRYLKYLMTYKKFLRQRNAGLKQKPVDFALMDVYTEKMGPAAVYICKKRKEIVQRILPFYEKYYSIFGSDTEGSTIQYDSQLNQVEFVDACKKSLNKDSLTGRTSIGIHRDDFKLLLNGFSARQFASQGQMKSILFALHLSKYEILKVGKEQTPIILLDDIFDKLDDRRVRLLMEILKGDEFGQIFITDTSQSRLRKIVADLNIKGYRFLEIQNGHAKVRPND
jgi:DNA replication and repair protein RecF